MPSEMWVLIRPDSGKMLHVTRPRTMQERREDVGRTLPTLTSSASSLSAPSSSSTSSLLSSWTTLTTSLGIGPSLVPTIFPSLSISGANTTLTPKGSSNTLTWSLFLGLWLSFPAFQCYSRKISPPLGFGKLCPHRVACKVFTSSIDCCVLYTNLHF